MKRVEKTSSILAKLSAAFGADADLSSLVVFEFIAANTLPLRKSGGLYKAARFTEMTMVEMTNYVERESVQVILNHNSEVMPVGRVFTATVKDEQLHILIALSDKTQPQLIADIESGILDQVSVGIMPAKLLCSECGFDYLGDDASFDNMWELTCNEGHTIGVDGVHARISGLETWTETSLVGKGAVRGARQVSRENSAFAEGPVFQRLAASSGLQTAMAVLCTNSITQPKNPKESPMSVDLSELVARVTTQAVQVSQLSASNTDLTSRLEASEAGLTAAQSEITDLKAKLEAAPAGEVFNTMLSAISEVTRKALVATGDVSPNLPSDPAELVALMNTTLGKLSAAIPVGPISKPSDSPSLVGPGDQLRAFTTAD